jgi:hypothetical protein
MAVPNSASSTTMRVLGILVFIACAAVIGVGVWYLRGGGIQESEEDVGLEEDDEDEPVDLSTDAGLHRRPKKKPGHRAGKPSAPRRAPGGAPAGPSGVSYEAAIAGNNVRLVPGMKGAPDLTDAQLAGPMQNATFLGACGVPSSTHVTVKVAIRGGHAVGVSVYAIPPSAPLAGCVERQVRGLRWPFSAKMDSFVTTY